MTGGRGRQAQDAGAQAVLPAVADLLDQLAVLERCDQARRRRLVHLERGGQLGHAGLAAAGEQVQNGQRPVHGLHLGLRLLAHPRTLAIDGTLPPAAPCFVSRPMLGIAQP